MTNQPLPVSAIIMTYNEEFNLESCLQSIVDWVEQVIVVDSFSTDATLDIARHYKACVYQNRYESPPQQWAWAFANVELKHEWLLMMDADFYITPALRSSITHAITINDPETDAYLFRRLQVFRGKPLRYGVSIHGRKFAWCATERPGLMQQVVLINNSLFQEMSEF